MRAELLVRAIATASGVDLVAVEREVVTELTRVRAQLKQGGPAPQQAGA